MNLSNPLQASLLKLSAKGISVFSPHTSLDATPNGINTWLVEPFKSITTSSSVIEESPNVPEGFEGAGMGRFIKLSKALQISEIVEMVKKHLGVDFGESLTNALSLVQIATPATEKPITSIAACAGSGGSVLGATTADLFLTGEMSHVGHGGRLPDPSTRSCPTLQRVDQSSLLTTPTPSDHISQPFFSPGWRNC